MHIEKGMKVPIGDINQEATSLPFSIDCYFHFSEKHIVLNL